LELDPLSGAGLEADILGEAPTMPEEDLDAAPNVDQPGGEDLAAPAELPPPATDETVEGEDASDQQSDPFLDETQPADQATTPCGRMYGPEGKRDCCQEEMDCRNLKILKSKPISTISLNIAPPFDPAPEAMGSDPQSQSKTLGKSEPRFWRDANGRVLGYGRLVDRTTSQVIIVDDDGQRMPIAYYSLGEDELCFLNAWWNTPPECRLSRDSTASRNWQATTFTWKASGLCHKPLYFDEERLERYGHSCGPILQPAASAAHFVLSLALLPYQMGIHPPNECMFALGYYRPGSCAPWLVPAFPLSLRGAAAQAAVVGALAPLPY
jgi:hypothetical protein